MESQDGTDTRPMRLKVLYTFDYENKTNCLARWPYVLDIQTVSLDENTAVGVIELETCVQAIVSASPELVAQPGKDYTVYVYDYSEYETPLVGQGMLSWVLASSSPIPEASAHQSKTLVIGRVCKNALGLFSKEAQETLEVKLRLVPIPTVMHSGCLDNMHNYRRLSNPIPGDVDAQSRTNFVRQNSVLLEFRTSSLVNQPRTERSHRHLSEDLTPREFPIFPPNKSVHSISPSQLYVAPSRVSKPGGSRMPVQHLPQSKQRIPHRDMIRPSASASMPDCALQTQVSYNPRTGSIHSGYDSDGEKSVEHQPWKRVKVYQKDWPGRSDMNVERQPSSLRVSANAAAYVRIHRPTPINHAIAADQSSEKSVRPPTPMSRPSTSLLRESSTSIASCTTSYTSPYCISDDIPFTTLTGQSPEYSCYQGLFDHPFTMPSLPPIVDSPFPNRSTPVSPPISLDTDSGFVSGESEELLNKWTATPLGGCRRAESRNITQDKRSTWTAVLASSPASAISAAQGTSNDPLPASNTPNEQTSKGAQTPLPRPATSAGSRPSSSAGACLAPKPPGPAISQSDVPKLMTANPASDPTVPYHPVIVNFLPCTTGITKRPKQVQTSLDQAIREGQVPPYCENCGSIETPTWRRASSKTIEGSEKIAEEMMRNTSMLFWLALERNTEGEVRKFIIYKKGLGETVNGWIQMLFCNPCGLWLYKAKSMRPVNRWNKPVLEEKRIRPLRNRKNGPLNPCPAT
ncbi:hypothetical protein N7471_013533 [Penicillium samsonianum]|uniref:uncharacterized protein n=1 Tax=Penicillium samsonianum TaxID=1882272 RepID=UPI0025488F5C|nr:uncharacterized protein N7471_013533 [Penicillium samsonianum]KAJ6118913.1 hypothetical protein N7471_013533 [Penicillium samsonianum]